MAADQVLQLVQTIGTWLAVAAALLAVYLQNLNSRRLIRVQLAVQLAMQYESDHIQAARSELANGLLANRLKASINDVVLLFFENVSYLLRTKQVDATVIWNSFGFDIPYYWIALAPQIEDMRKQFGDPSLYEELQNMAITMSAAQRSPRGTLIPKLDLSSASVDRFLQLEANRAKPAR